MNDNREEFLTEQFNNFRSDCEKEIDKIRDNVSGYYNLNSQQYSSLKSDLSSVENQIECMKHRLNKVDKMINSICIAIIVLTLVQFL